MLNEIQLINFISMYSAEKGGGKHCSFDGKIQISKLGKYTFPNFENLFTDCGEYKITCIY